VNTALADAKYIREKASVEIALWAREGIESTLVLKVASPFYISCGRGFRRKHAGITWAARRAVSSLFEAVAAAFK
jgi:hypothetical protein